MNEIMILRVGIWIGYAITTGCIILAYYILMSYKLRKFSKYLYETKQLQTYEEWENKQKKTIKIIKGGK
jgi:hypothetical protein